MAYERTIWENGSTPINAENLNNIEEGIHEAKTEVRSVEVGGTGADNAVEAAKNLGYGKVLWSGGSYMNESHEMTLDEAISAQPHGIILVFSRYDGGAVNDTFASHYVSKKLVELMRNNSHMFLMATGAFKDTACKILYITDTTVKGYSTNISNGTTSGITYNNSHYVLRYVIGV